ncbi:antiviral reverse transcriptase Drt3b [Dickeya zeae]|uniref:antiviral reverse transcriptase Drt3b n=1 Tax=Dickeya zeae TaxID=204042 RepID=UPI002047C0A4|nr:antiviral reverse transcriptase Drt3b [Dickeya zeae]UPT57536.1 RNA-directed DNA polymerase [Dickeya zeae]
MFKNKINKKDFFRVLVTETIPYETPIIYSNDGFYKNCIDVKNNVIENDIFDFLIIGMKRKKNYTIPYQYKIRKNENEYRKLSILHPISQIEIKDFYKKYSGLICYFCTRSSFSIRSPNKVASTVYYSNHWDNIKKYKRESVNNIENDMLTRHSASFFSYGGYDRIYKFYNSFEFKNLERDFPFFWTLDVTKCFDSIYTHSISWAIKNKDTVKLNMGGSNGFGNEFDGLMQHANYNETNGIVIGPEVSRIFAEIILQRIDSLVEERLLSMKGLSFGSDYSVKRYVDDVFIFGSNEETVGIVFELYSDYLTKFNLHVNKSKALRYQRPFFSVKSNLILRVAGQINSFVDGFLDKSNPERGILIPKRIYKRTKMINKFIDSIKSSCIENSVGYNEVSSYIISAIFERVKKIVGGNYIEAINDDYEYDLKNAFTVLIDCLFFFYSVSPSVSSSYKLCSSLILINRFSEEKFNIYKDSIHQKIYESILSLFSGNFIKNESMVDNFVFLEAINLCLTINELGNGYLLPEGILSKVFKDFNSYYNITSCLFVIKNKTMYSDLRGKILSSIDDKLSDLSDLQTDAEKCSLFLDLITCPYIDEKRKRIWIRSFYSSVQKSCPARSEIDEFILYFQDKYWFIDWKTVDLLNALERKELKKAY